MEVLICDATLDGIDSLVADAVLLPFFSDERPLKGVSSLFDWRVCGRLSETLVEDKVVGLLGDKGRASLRPQLRIDQAVLMGMGPRASFDRQRLRQACEEMLAEAQVLDATHLVCALPGRNHALVSADAALTALLEHVASSSSLRRITVVEDASERKALSSVVAQHERKQRIRL